MNLEIELYTKERGNSPIISFIEKLPISAKAKTIETFELLSKYGTLLGMPYVKSVTGVRQLWELRIKSDTNIYRYFFFIKNGKIIVILHAYQKKSSGIPKNDLKIVKHRLKEML